MMNVGVLVKISEGESQELYDRGSRDRELFFAINHSSLNLHLRGAAREQLKVYSGGCRGKVVGFSWSSIGSSRQNLDETFRR